MVSGTQSITSGCSSKVITVNTGLVVLSFMLSSSTRLCTCWWFWELCCAFCLWEPTMGIKITVIWASSAWCTLEVAVAVPCHFHRINLLQVLKMDLKTTQQQKTNNKIEASSCSKDVSRVWRLPSVKIVVAVPELVCAFTRWTRWLSFAWILNFVLTVHFLLSLWKSELSLSPSAKRELDSLLRPFGLQWNSCVLCCM